MKKFNNLKVQVACLPECEKEIKKIFFDILNDYSQRFSVEVTDDEVKINICIIEYDEGSESQGLTTFSEDNKKILIQVRDPFLSNFEANPYVMEQFVNILCHEMVHACQHLTGRKGFKVRGMHIDKYNPQEAYFFDSEEMEARALEAPYSTFYGYIIK